MCPRMGQIALLRVDPKKSFKTKMLRGFLRPSAKNHLIEKQGVTNLEISENSVHRTMLQKINAVRGFFEDLARNFLFENKGVI